MYSPVKDINFRIWTGAFEKCFYCWDVILLDSVLIEFCRFKGVLHHLETVIVKIELVFIASDIVYRLSVTCSKPEVALVATIWDLGQDLIWFLS
ncbi:unnamed protein product, partial [Clonostachys rhizophaga]